MVISSFERQSRAAFALATLILGVVLALSYRNTTNAFRNQEWVIHASEIRPALRDLQTLVLALSSYCQGYVLTRKETLLDVCHDAMGKSGRALTAVRTLDSGHPDHLEQMNALSQLLRSYILLTMESMAAVRDDPRNLRSRADYASRTESIMDGINVLMASIEREENLLLESRKMLAAKGMRSSLSLILFGGLLGFALLGTAIWENRRSMEALSRSERELAHSEQRLELALESAQMGAWDLDIVADKAERNLQHDQIFGYPSKQPGWGTKVFLEHVVNEDRAAAKKCFEDAYSSGVFHLECRIRWPDHSVHWISASGRVSRDTAGKPVRMTGTLMDITAPKEAENKMREAAEIKSEFASMVSHELRTPLTVIKLALVAAADAAQGPSSSLQREALQIAERNIGRLSRLVDDILDFQKLGNGQMTFNMKAGDLSRVLLEIITAFKPLARERGLQLDADLAKNVPPIVFDRDRITQVVSNLVNNALKFTQHGRVTVRTTVQNDCVRVAIEDSGPGIRRNDLAKLFRTFSQIETEDCARQQGTGLGLAISKKIVESHGGHIGVKTAYGRGSTFFFTLRLHPAPVAG